MIKLVFAGHICLISLFVDLLYLTFISKFLPQNILPKILPQKGDFGQNLRRAPRVLNIFCCNFLCSHRLLLVVSSRMTPHSPPDSISGHENFSKKCPKQGSKSVKNTIFSKMQKGTK